MLPTHIKGMPPHRLCSPALTDQRHQVTARHLAGDGLVDAALVCGRWGSSAAGWSRAGKGGRCQVVLSWHAVIASAP